MHLIAIHVVLMLNDCMIKSNEYLCFYFCRLQTMGMTMPYRTNDTIRTMDQCALNEEPENICSICNNCGNPTTIPILVVLVFCVVVAIDIFYHRFARHTIQKMHDIHADVNIEQDPVNDPSAEGQFAEVVAVLTDCDPTQWQSPAPVAVGIRISENDVDNNDVNIRLDAFPVASAVPLTADATIERP